MVGGELVVPVHHSSATFQFEHASEDDHIFLIHKAGQFYEAPLLEFLGEELKQGDIVLDVGANIGNHTVYFSGVCGARTVCFEPNSFAANLLERNVARNGLNSRVDIRRVGVGRAGDEYRLDSTNSVNNLGSVRLSPDGGGPAVEVVALDSLDLPRPVKLIKIDVEGMELDVLLGAVRLLREDKPILVVEIPERDVFNLIGGLLSSMGYKLRSTFNYTATSVFTMSVSHEEAVEIVPEQFLYLAGSSLAVLQRAHELRQMQRSVRRTMRSVQKQVSQLSREAESVNRQLSRISAQIESMDQDPAWLASLRRIFRKLTRSS